MGLEWALIVTLVVAAWVIVEQAIRIGHLETQIRRQDDELAWRRLVGVSKRSPPPPP